jgi:hypothetical protein
MSFNQLLLIADRGQAARDASHADSKPLVLLFPALEQGEVMYRIYSRWFEAQDSGAMDKLWRADFRIEKRRA